MATRGKREGLLTEQEVADITGMSVASVRRWRLMRAGPRFLKLGFSVRYKLSDVEAWLNSRPSGGEQCERVMEEHRATA